MRDPALGLRQNLRRRAIIVGFPIRGIVVLIGVKIAFGIGTVNLLAKPDGTVGTLGLIAKNHLGIVGLQDVLAFDGDVFRQAELYFIAQIRADHGVGDARVPAGGV